MPPMVYLNREPFVQLILAAIEMYPLETTGLIFGFRDRDPSTVDYEVIMANPHIKVEERKQNAVIEHYSAMLHLIEGHKQITGMVHLGGYHSHPEDDARFSKSDKEYLASKGLDTIEIVIGIEELSHADEEVIGWDINDNDLVVKAVVPIGAKIYEISLRAYRVKNEKVEKLDIRCAYIEMIDALNQYGKFNFSSIGEIYNYCRSLGKDVYPLYDLLAELEDSLEDKKREIKQVVQELRDYLDEVEE